MQSPSLAGLSTQERKIISHFSALEKIIITPDDLISFWPSKRSTALQILSRLNKKGWLKRIKRGTYTLVPITATSTTDMSEHTWPLAMQLFQPSFISGWSAAEYWDLTEQIFNQVTVVTTVPQKATLQNLNGITFRTRTVNQNHFFGFQPTWLNNKQINIATPERLIVDILDLPHFGGGMRHVIDIIRQYWLLEHKNPKILIEYAKRYRKGSVWKRLGFLTEKLHPDISQNWLKTCQKNLTTGISLLDPDGPKTGPIISQWNLQINTPVPNDY